MTGKTLLILNPIAGKGVGKRHLLDIVTRLSDGGCDVTVLPTKKGTETVERIAAMLAKDSTYQMVVACGGDGTLNTAVEGMARGGRMLPLGYIPLGSTNDFASSLGLSSDVPTAVERILKGTPVPHALGTFTGRRFTYVACCGAFADTSYSTSQSMKNLLGHTAYVINAIPSLASLRPLNLIITADGETIEGKSVFCGIGNTTVMAGTVKLGADTVDFNDGMFELLLIRFPHDLIEAGRIATKLLSGSIDDPTISIRKVHCCRILSAEPVAWSLDGEEGGKSKNSTVSVEKSALYILK